ncbi:putative PHP domain protein [uncultured Spirochaetota bacterium]|uniref:Putative PHP domain protein n=1 Tax=uncultured Spirochaetota bacterium TaxID=460511 RepID=A0A652ZU01_9SPIR|nr:putative PHP domain protein [uncultured Spirochaetota bacterium]
MNANLHLHSKFSDGSLWPEDIVRGAARLGLDLIALTDHDTMGGSDRFAAECAAQGLSWVSACEIDVADPAVGYKSELLAYFPGKTPQDCAATGAMLQRVLDERRKRLDYYLYWARTFFKREDLTLEDMIARRKADDDVGGGDELPLLSWSKVDLFLYLRNNKLVPAYMNYKIFKKEWMRPGRFPKYKLSKPDTASCLAAVHADRGFAVIPHIGHLWNDNPEEMERQRPQLEALLGYFKGRGVDGVELYWYSGNKKTRAINELVRGIAGPMGYFFTYGSDCHGPDTDKYTIDKFSGDFPGFPLPGR